MRSFSRMLYIVVIVQRPRKVLTGHIKVTYLVLIVHESCHSKNGTLVWYLHYNSFKLHHTSLYSDVMFYLFFHFQCHGFSSHPREPCISWMCKWRTGCTITGVWHAIGTQERPDRAIVPGSLSQVGGIPKSSFLRNLKPVRGYLWSCDICTWLWMTQVNTLMWTINKDTVH